MRCHTSSIVRYLHVHHKRARRIGATGGARVGQEVVTAVRVTGRNWVHRIWVDCTVWGRKEAQRGRDTPGSCRSFPAQGVVPSLSRPAAPVSFGRVTSQTRSGEPGRNIDTKRKWWLRVKVCDEKQRYVPTLSWERCVRGEAYPPGSPIVPVLCVLPLLPVKDQTTAPPSSNQQRENMCRNKPGEREP